PLLRKTSREVEEITPRIKTLIDDMVETLHRANGCGLAAPQVGILRRVVIVETEPGVIYKMINPEIIKTSGEQEEAEGCLSIPGKWGITKRPAKVTVRATGIDGRKFEVTGEGLLARAFCHELDHLDGKLFTDCTVRMLDPDEVE
ncbi:MAG: peptide deformylase, partial [Clostridia bacterium]|nr:peptide deformylase [Clostridia bacterium]